MEFVGYAKANVTREVAPVRLVRRQRISVAVRLGLVGIIVIRILIKV